MAVFRFRYHIGTKKPPHRGGRSNLYRVSKRSLGGSKIRRRAHHFAPPPLALRRVRTWITGDSLNCKSGGHFRFKVQLEAKIELKGRLGRSPDRCDAAMAGRDYHSAPRYQAPQQQPQGLEYRGLQLILCTTHEKSRKFSNSFRTPPQPNGSLISPSLPSLIFSLTAKLLNVR